MNPSDPASAACSRVIDGGLDLAVSAVFDAELAWYAEVDGLPTEKKPHLHGACRILDHRFPGVPNIGDVTTVDWAALAGTIEILTGGSPCQDLSHAGKRAGMTAGTRSNLWVAMREAIAVIRPPVVIWENVRGAFSAEATSDLESDAGLLAGVRRRDGEPVLRALGRVLGDLSDLGYDASWHTLRAADVGAPHGRPRVFVLATDASCDPWWLGYGDREDAADTGGEARLERPGLREGVEAGVGRGRLADGGRPVPVLPTPRATDGTKGSPNQRGSSGDLMLTGAVMKNLPTPSQRDYKDHTIRAEPHRPDDRDTLARALVDVPAAMPLLPTPNPFHAGNTESPEEWRRRRKDVFDRTGTRHGPALSVVAWSIKDGEPLTPDRYMPDDEAEAEPARRLLPTPNTQDATGAGSAASRDAGSQAQLHDTVKKLLPTPVVTDASDSARHTTRTGVAHPGTSLTDATRLLPTPGAALADGGQTSRSWDGTCPHDLDCNGRCDGVTPNPGDDESELFVFELPEDDDDFELALLPTPLVGSTAPSAHGQISGQYRDDAMNDALARWGDYAPAIQRWESLLGRPAPDPTMVSKKGNPQLSPRFVEWMQGIPEGWICDIPGVTRNEALRALGNGVVPQQAAAAIRIMLQWNR